MRLKPVGSYANSMATTQPSPFSAGVSTDYFFDLPGQNLLRVVRQGLPGVCAPRDSAAGPAQAVKIAFAAPEPRALNPLS